MSGSAWRWLQRVVENYSRFFCRYRQRVELQLHRHQLVPAPDFEPEYSFGSRLVNNIAKFLDAEDLFAVHINNQIVRFQAGLGCRRVWHRILDPRRGALKDIRYQNDSMVASWAGRRFFPYGRLIFATL